MPDEPRGQFGTVHGHAGDVTVSLDGLSYRQTTKGKRYPYPDFGAEFIDALHKQPIGPGRRGLLRKLSCPTCGASVEGVPSAAVEVAVELTFKRISPIRVQLEIPGIVCAACGRGMVRIDDRDVASDLSDALIDAFNSVDMRPG